MPFYKCIGNRILTRFENRMLGTRLTEFHSGYRAYTRPRCRGSRSRHNSDGFDFDTQIIAQIVHAGGRIVEVPIPTYYGDEICYVNGIQYARDVVRDVVEFKLATKGFGTSEWVATPEEYAFKEGDGSSHAVMLGDAARGCHRRGSSTWAALAASSPSGRGRPGTMSPASTAIEVPGVRERTDRFFAADLDEGIPAEVGRRLRRRRRRRRHRAPAAARATC